MGESFSQLEERAKRATTIKELFGWWQQAHEAEVDEKTELTTCPFQSKDKARKNFTVDCRLGETQKGGVLFICKESNLSGDIRDEEKHFWLKEEVVLNQPSICAPSQIKRVKSAKTYYRNCLGKTLNVLLEKGYPAPKNLENCAYMNLNKRGGNSTCNRTVLFAYIARYKTFIKREVELLQCDTVVLYSASSYGKKAMKMIEHIFRSANVKTIVKINCHPSRYSCKKIEDMEIHE